jgi:hypothetical protein
MLFDIPWICLVLKPNTLQLGEARMDALAQQLKLHHAARILHKLLAPREWLMVFLLFPHNHSMLSSIFPAGNHVIQRTLQVSQAGRVHGQGDVIQPDLQDPGYHPFVVLYIFFHICYLMSIPCVPIIFRSGFKCILGALNPQSRG